MWPFRKSTPPPSSVQPMPGWLKLLLIAFIGYVLVVGNLPSKNDKPNPVKQSLEQAKHDLKSQEIFDLSGYQNKIFPNQSNKLSIKELAEGTGDPAVCGQTITMAYQAYLGQGNEIDDRATADKPLRFILGLGQTMPVFEQGAMGMKVGAKRSIIAPAATNYGLEAYKRDDIVKSETYRFDIEMISVEPKLPNITNSLFRIADLSAGTGRLIACGDEARFRVMIWNAKNKILFSNVENAEPLVMHIGASKHMLGLEQGVIGMRVGGTRLLVIPPTFQKTLTGSASMLKISSTNDEVLLVEITALP